MCIKMIFLLSSDENGGWPCCFYEAKQTYIGGENFIIFSFLPEFDGSVMHEALNSYALEFIFGA